MKEVVLITGGMRSGKSRFAEEYALKRSSSPIYLATGVAVDEEFARRIAYHRSERDGRFATVEETKDVVGVVSGFHQAQVIVFECVTTWLANLFHERNWQFTVEDEKWLKMEVVRLVEGVKDGNHTLIVVTNEIGLGVVPADEVSRRYVEVLGRCNQWLAQRADEVYFLVSGIPWRLK
ncbi:bifunctional adenosylcobinamide kinase/adenosylcobinamide-phosphate guanylyltransferase [Thermospira aquatica]|uniref:Adenosylcobinamide kinase n=1 Tax=Thermospira aquatica TaxID=2828656 RepID=A0AAX3BAQ1_9SPIR|nr:bifunctional adenosylcobinamide kinase/adenosylcobinamide-phosphate guanylyltransferase [Thermospira aquatica]URA09344.1 bifunctional adenosylcobinamide kinase/adenosylcobinamide-phosphate guanylyltransferase [Thermospira aquatica]